MTIMDNCNFLSSFTPSLMSSNALEAMFVQRQKLVKKLIESVFDSVETANKYFYLLIGMRGIGKTHTIALIYHRLKKREELQDKLLIAWLKEEEWGVSSWLDLLIRIFKALEIEYPELYKTQFKEKIEALYQLSPDDATYQAERLLQEFVGNKTLLLLTENLDDIFDGLGNIGQKQFRAYLQNSNLINIIATSKSLFNGVSEKDSPFYGFFNPKYLYKLTIEQATELLRNIAQLQQDQELASFINSSTGKDRIQAIHHLSGGNHRVYVIFSQFLTRNSLDELVQPVMKTLDELTPYYQARMQWLSPQQRKIIELLCEKSNALPVKEIAQRCFISHQTASGQLKDLRKKGYVTHESIGRESFYELQEPLMRICLEVKKQRGKPIKLFIDFLRIWYTKEELQERLLQLPEECLERDYINHALKVQESLMRENVGQKSIAVEELVIEGVKESEAGNLEVALELFDQVIKNNDSDINAWYNRGVVLFDLERLEEAIISYEKALELKPDFYQAWNNRGNILISLGKLEEAVISYDKALELKPDIYETWMVRGNILVRLGKLEEAITSYDKVLELKLDIYEIWLIRGIVLYGLGRLSEAILSCDKVLEFDPDNVDAWFIRGMVLYSLGSFDEALLSYDKALELKPDDVFYILYNRGLVLDDLGEFDKAINSYQKSLELKPNDVQLWNNRGISLAKLHKLEDAITSFDKALEFEPDYYHAWNNKGIASYKLGRFEEAIASYEKVISLNPKEASPWFNRVEAILRLNNWQEGFKQLNDALNRFANEKESYTGDTTEYIKIIWDSTRDIDVWKSRIETLVNLYDKHQVVSNLSKGMVDHIPILMSEMVSDKLARTWLESWQSIVGDKRELSIALRFIKIAVEYKETKGDRRVLMKLAKEEREILEPLVSNDTSSQK